jgi:7-cyano-7-deazaguanine synthase
MKKVVLGLSGGMDSATLLGYFIGQGFDSIHCCSYMYGSKHNDYELAAAGKIIQYYNDFTADQLNKSIDRITTVHHHIFDIRNIFTNIQSNLMQSGGEIPEGHYEEKNMKKTVVPGRNLIFASIMASVAESEGAEKIALGVHSGDHHIYPDCRPAFIDRLTETIHQSTDGKVEVIAPFTDFDKTEILKLGYSLNPQVPYHLTRTCYKNQPISCGKCGSCNERLEAFQMINKKDPIQYE